MGRTRINSTATVGANKVQLKESKNDIVDTSDHQIDTPSTAAAPRTRRSLTFSKEQKTKTVNKMMMETEAVIVVPADNKNRVVGRTRSRRSTTVAAAATFMQSNLILNNDKRNNNKEKILNINNSTATATTIDLGSSSSSFNKNKINLDKKLEQEEEEEEAEYETTILTRIEGKDNYVSQLENDPNVVSVIEIIDEPYIDHTKPSTTGSCEGGSTRDDGSSPATTVMSIIDEDSRATSNCSALIQDNSECSQYYVEIVDSVSQDDFVQLKTNTNNRISPKNVITIGNKINDFSGTYQQESELIANINDNGSSSCSDVAVKNHIQNFNLQNSTSADSESLTTDSLQSNPDPPIKVLRTYQNKRKARSNRASVVTSEKVFSMSSSNSSEPKPSEFHISEKINIEDNSESGSSNDRQINLTSIVENTERRRSQRKPIRRYEVLDLFNKGKKGNKNSTGNKSVSPPLQANVVSTVSHNNSNDGEESTTSDISRYADSPQVFKGFSDSECSKMSPIIVNEQLRNNLDESSNSSGSLKFGLLAGRRTNSPKIGKNIFSNIALNLDKEKAVRSKQKVDATTDEVAIKNLENSKRFTRTYLRNRENGKIINDDKDDASSSPVNIKIYDISKEDKTIDSQLLKNINEKGGKLKEEKLKGNEIKTVTEEKIIDNHVVTVLEKEKLNKVKTAKDDDKQIVLTEEITSIKEEKLKGNHNKSVKGGESILKEDKVKGKKEKNLKKGQISKEMKSKDTEIKTVQVQGNFKEDKPKKHPKDNQVKTVEVEGCTNENKLTDNQKKTLNVEETLSQQNKLKIAIEEAILNDKPSKTPFKMALVEDECTKEDESKDDQLLIHRKEKCTKENTSKDDQLLIHRKDKGSGELKTVSVEKTKIVDEEKSSQLKTVKRDRITRQFKSKGNQLMKDVQKEDTLKKDNIISKKEEACNQTPLLGTTSTPKGEHLKDNLTKETSKKNVLKDDSTKDNQSKTTDVQVEGYSNENKLNTKEEESCQKDKSIDSQLKPEVDKIIQDNSSIKDNVLDQSNTKTITEENKVVGDLEKQPTLLNIKNFQDTKDNVKKFNELNVKDAIVSNIRKLRNSRLKSTPAYQVASLENKSQEISRKMTRKTRAQLDLVDKKDSTLLPPPISIVLEESCSLSPKTELLEKKPETKTGIENKAAAGNLIEDVCNPEEHLDTNNEISSNVSLSTNNTNNNGVSSIPDLGNESIIKDQSNVDIIESNTEIADSLLSAYDGVEISTEDQTDNVLTTEVVIENEIIEGKEDEVVFTVQNEDIVDTETMPPNTTTTTTTTTTAETIPNKNPKNGAASRKTTKKKKQDDIKKPKKNNVKTFKIVQSTKNKKKTVINKKMNSVKINKTDIIQKDKKLKTNKIIKTKLEKNSTTKRKIKNILKKNKTSPTNVLKEESLVTDKTEAVKIQITTDNPVSIPILHVTGDSEYVVVREAPAPPVHNATEKARLKKVTKKKPARKSSVKKIKKTGDLVKTIRKRKTPLNKKLLSKINKSDIKQEPLTNTINTITTITTTTAATTPNIAEKCDIATEPIIEEATTAKSKKPRKTDKLAKINDDVDQKAENERMKLLNMISMHDPTTFQDQHKPVEIVKEVIVEEIKTTVAVAEDKKKQSKTNEIFKIFPEISTDKMDNYTEQIVEKELVNENINTRKIQSNKKQMEVDKNPDYIYPSTSFTIETEKPKKEIKPPDLSDSNSSAPANDQQPDKLIKRPPYMSDSNSSSAFSEQNQDHFKNINESISVKNKNKSKTKKSEETFSKKEKLNTSSSDSDTTKSRYKKTSGKKVKNESQGLKLPQKPISPVALPKEPAIFEIKQKIDKSIAGNLETQPKSQNNEILIKKDKEPELEISRVTEPNQIKSNLKTSNEQKQSATVLSPPFVKSTILFDSNNKKKSLVSTEKLNEGTVDSLSKVNVKGKRRENRTTRWDSPKSLNVSVKEISSTNPSNLVDNLMKENPSTLQDIHKKAINIIKDNAEIIPTTLQCENAVSVNETTSSSSSYSVKESSEKMELPADKPGIKPLKDDKLSQESSYKNDENSNSHQPPQPRDESDSSMDSNIRRSHRIKTISKTKPQSVGRGLVKDRERFSLKEDNRNFSSDKIHMTDSKNQAVIKTTNMINNINMELKDIDRLGQFNVIKENEYKCERVISKEAKKMVCDCFLTADEADRGELGCGEDCLNRLLMIECGPKCIVADRCTNRRFQRNVYAACKVFRTEKKGYGLMADGPVLPGEFIMEYVGEVLNGKQFEKRAGIYSQDKNKHYYFMALRSDAIIDATGKGNISRFINHSCDPNAETQKWTVNGELRIGFFSKKRIYPGEEITFDYQFQRYGKEAQKCYCESSNCRGWIGEEPDSEDEDEDEEEEDEEEVSSSAGESDLEHETEKEKNLLVPQPELEYSLEKPQEVPVETITELIPEIIPVKDSVTEIILPEVKPISKPEPGISVKSLEDINKEEPIVVSPVKVPKPPLTAEEKKKRVLQKLKAKREQRFKQQLLEEPDLEDEIGSLTMSGLKNQSHTLRLSRLMVRAKSLGSRVRLLEILGKAELPCRRLFLDYHGLRLLHGWMIETDTVDTEQELEYRLLIVETLDTLPIPNKTMLKDSKVLHTIQIWANEKEMNSSSPDDSPSDSGSATPIVGTDGVVQTKPENIIKLKPSINEDYDSIISEIHEIATKLIRNWEGLPEVFRIPKRERIEQMKEHEREADRQYKALNLTDEDHYKLEAQITKRNKERFGRFGSKSSSYKTNKWKQEKSDRDRDRLSKKAQKFKRKEIDNNNKMNQDTSLTKVQRRELFAAQVAKDEADKRLAEERRIYEIKCKFYGLEATKLIPVDMPFCVNPASGQWYTEDKRKIETPPSHAHIQVPPRPMSTDPNDYDLPPMDLPPFWKFAIDTRGRVYYYHIKIRIPQWEPPIKILPLDNASIDEPRPGTSKDSNMKRKHPDDDSTDDDDDDGSTDSDDSNTEDKEDEHLDTKEIKKEIDEEYDELRRSRQRERHTLLVQQRTISPRREEDRLYNQIEMKRYRENKEKIRRRKEEIKRRKRHQEGSTAGNSDNQAGTLPLPIQDYLISSDEDDILKSEGGSPLLIKFGQGDKIVDELDALTKERPLKRPLPIKDRSEYKKRLKLLEEKKIVEAVSLSATISSSSSSQKSTSSGSKKSSISSSQKSSSNSSEHRKSESSSSSSKGSGKYLGRKAKEKFRGDIAGIIVHHLTPYRKESCKIGKITNNEDFKHLARKLTHFVMIKELRHCESNGQPLIVTESVKNKSREFIKKYMAKYGEIYVRPLNDPEFKDILH